MRIKQLQTIRIIKRTIYKLEIKLAGIREDLIAGSEIYSNLFSDILSENLNEGERARVESVMNKFKDSMTRLSNAEKETFTTIQFAQKELDQFIEETNELIKYN